jgi:MrfA Zn-binding domain
MGQKQIRIGQLVAPFGPGSIYTDRRGIPHVVGGLDYWFMNWNQGLSRMTPCSDRSEFERFEPRLSALLRVDRFCLPPDFRPENFGDANPPNAGLHIPAVRFPRWYRHTRTGQIRRFNLHSTHTGIPEGGGRWQPVRFISVCMGGHLGEFPWKQWIDCQCADDGDLYLTDRGGSELSSIRIECKSCPTGSPGRRGRDLSGTTIVPDSMSGRETAFQRKGIPCPGELPWLGEGAVELNCAHALVGALINQTNIYFPRTLSAITLPDVEQEDSAVSALSREIEKEQGLLGTARTVWKMGMKREAAAMFRQSLQDRGIAAELELVEEALGAIFGVLAATIPGDAQLPQMPESELLGFRRAEFNILRNEVNDPERIPNLRVIATPVPEDLGTWFQRITLVERLRETRVFFGFDRLQPNPTPLLGMPDTAMAQLFRSRPTERQEQWLPAVETFGEGIYIELQETQIARWFRRNEQTLRGRLDDAFVVRLAGIFQTLPPLAPATTSWASRFLLIHSLAHILINQLVFECGYSTASLRERLYISADPGAPMASMLIYTAAGDAEGTLGGLVRLGRPERLGAVLARALDRASWCSADPVCSEHLGGQGSRLANLAACHACILLPETSCETINQGLDRAMVVGTPEHREFGFFSTLLDSSHALI